jgi:AcrR family transcriptional regulator
MSIREERKRQTRQALIDAALDLMTEGSSFGELSLRAVARRADVVPTTFYRHFEAMEELGLELVDQVFLTLRRVMREVRQGSRDYEHIVRDSIRTYLSHVENNPRAFAFIARERYGSSRAVRDAIAREIRFFVIELAEDLSRFKQSDGLEQADLEMIAHLIVSVVANLSGDALDLLEGPLQRYRDAEERTVRQITLVIAGSLALAQRRAAL